VEFTVVGEFSPSPKKWSNWRYNESVEVDIEERKSGFGWAKSIGVRSTPAPGDEVSVWS